MRRLLLLAGLLIVVLAISASAASFTVAPSVLQSFHLSVDIDVPDPPDDRVAIEWEGHGREHEDPHCVGTLTWRFVLTGQSGGTDADLEVVLDSGAELEAEGQQRGGGHGGAIHFEVELETDGGATIEQATAYVSGDGGRNPVLTLGATACDEGDVPQ